MVWVTSAGSTWGASRNFPSVTVKVLPRLGSRPPRRLASAACPRQSTSARCSAVAYTVNIRLRTWERSEGTAARESMPEVSEGEQQRSGPPTRQEATTTHPVSARGSSIVTGLVPVTVWRWRAASVRRRPAAGSNKQRPTRQWLGAKES